MSYRNRASFASAVSRALRTRGLRPLPSGTPIGRDGVSVGAFLDTAATITVAYEALPTRTRRVADQISEALTDAGYEVSDSRPAEVSDIVVLHITRPAKDVTR